MTGFTLKIIALVTMVLDHVKYAIPITDCFITKYFGRISFPIFAFLVTEGYLHTRSKTKYILRLFVFALISQIPFMLFRSLVADRFLLNILFTFLFALLGICAFEWISKQEKMSSFLKFLNIFIIDFSIILLGATIPVDYNWFGISVVWIFYIFKNQKIFMSLLYIITVTLYYINMYLGDISSLNWRGMLCTMLPLFLILFYNGKEGRKIKYFFYLFYPIHMLILYGASFLF